MPTGADRGGEAECPGPFGMIILAGGRARRLGGRDKPAMTVGKDTLLGAVVNAGAAAGARPIVVVGPARAGLSPDVGGVRFVRETPPGAGPVPALRRGLAELAPSGLAPSELDPSGVSPSGVGPSESAVPLVAVLAADLPFLRASHLRTLLRAAQDGAGAVLADDGGRPQWLAGCWQAAALRAAAARYHGDSLRGLFAPLRPALVRLAPAEGQPPPWLDCDTPDDLRRARELAGEQAADIIQGELNTHGSSGRPG
ncbi:MAG: NTP transferase domain-containing protein [Actinobacteria bacterium]|nr:NTP transferase domain-containing protein [Actinomycetota bacterium]